MVVAEKTIEHDFKIRFFVRPEPEFPGDPKLIAQLQRENDFSFRVHFGVIASGDEDIVDAARARELRAQTSAIAVAWEGAGGARAAKFNKVPFLEIRGITDTADSGAPIDFSANLKVAMSNVGDVLLKAFHSES